MHTAYMMEHYIRRMPMHNGRRVQRVCLLMDMRGFRACTLPYVRECINVLRMHYPGRLGAACFFRVPGYFIPVWNLIRPLLDEARAHRRVPTATTDPRIPGACIAPHVRAQLPPPPDPQEIMFKTHFLPSTVRDVEGAIRWCNQRELQAF